jgi:transposase
VVDGSDDATCLFGLGGLAVERVVLTGLGVRIVQLVTDDPDAACCPNCRVRSTSGKDWVLTRPHDLPSGGGQVAVQWRKRRWRCRSLDCARQTFTEQVAQVPAGMRTTTRLRTALALAVEDGRDQSEVAASHGVSWPTVARAVVVHGAVELVEPEPTAVLGMDETRFGCPRWLPDGHHDDGRIRWQRTDPWETGFIDITGDQALLGQVDGRTSAAVQAWLAARSAAFRAAIEVVVIDPHAGYAAAVRAALPDAQIAVDHFHLIMLANKVVTAVRQRVTRDLLDRRGRKSDPTWANRRLLLRGRERLSQAALARMWNSCIDHDPTGQILSAWIAKEELRVLCALAARGGHRHEIRERLYAFYRWCADADIPELTTLAETIETWWPAIEVFLTTGLTNARTEGTNRLIKQVKRAACGFRNRNNYRRRGTVALHPAHPPTVSEEPDGARLKLKSRIAPGPDPVVGVAGIWPCWSSP